MSNLKTMTSLSVVAILAIAALTPLASAATEIDVTFSTASNPSVAGAKTLMAAEEAETKIVDSGQLELPALFAMENALATGASFANADYNYTIYLATPSGTATVSLGYANADGSFTPLVVTTVDVERESRGVLHELELEPSGAPIDIGVAHAHLGPVTGSYPAGSFVAIKVESSIENDMFTKSSHLGAADQSTATVPLPELTAGLLFILGLATIAGFAVIRSRKEA